MKEFFGKNIYVKSLIFIGFLIGAIGGNSVLAQGCTNLYGPTGEPLLGVSYKLCATPGVVTLNALAPLASMQTSYSWSSGGFLPSETVTAGGVYTVTVLDSASMDTCILNFTVTAYANPVVNLGPDTSICAGSVFTLNAPIGMQTYNWSNGSAGVDSLVVATADTYSVTVSDTNNCSGLDSIIVLENPLPNPNLPDSATACPGDSVAVDAGAVYVSYIWSNGSTNQILETNIVGLYTVTVTDINGCEGSDIVTVANDTIPIVNIGANDSICDGNSKILNAGAGPYTSYLWSDGTSAQTATFTITSDPWVIVEDTNGCFGSDTMHLEVNPLPIVNIGANTLICAGDSVVLDAGPGFVSYSWNNGLPSQTLTVTSPGVYSVTVEDGNTCFGSDTNVVTQASLPIVNIGPDIEYCQGTTFNQLIDAGSGWVLQTWMDGVFTQIRNIDETNDTVWVEVVDTNGCTNTDTLYVIENALPLLNLGIDDTICASQIYSLNAGNPNSSIVSYNWSTGSSNQTITINPNPNQIADSAADYSVTITDFNGCSSIDTMNLFSYALPKPDLGNDTAYCVGDPFTMVLDPGTFVSYSWSTGAFTPTITIGATGTIYTVTVTDGNGCANSDNIQVIENPLPVPNLGPDESFCSGSNFTKILVPGSFVSYLWQDGSVGQVLGISAAGTYSVTVTDINGCQNLDDIVITENLSPNVNIGPDVNYCEDEVLSHLLDASAGLPGPGFNFLWNTGQVSPTIVATSFGNYSVLVTDQVTACSTLSTVEILATIKADPYLGEDGVLCDGQFKLLDPNVNLQGYNYTWNTGATTSTLNVFETGTYWVRLDAQNGTCVGIIDTIVLDPGLTPVVELGPDLYPCKGQVVQLLNDQTAFTDAAYEWQDGSDKKQYIADETGTYEVSVSNECGTVVDQVYIDFQDCSNIYVPTAFSPNADGRNDFFTPETDQEFKEYGFWVYDRWGKLLFKTNTPNFGWNGTMDGNDAPVGVYVWRLSYVSAFQNGGDRVEQVGEVTLVK